MNKYKKGYTFECQVRDDYEAAGWKVIRSSGSKGAVDLACFKEGAVLQIQCKNSKKATKPSKEEMNKIDEWVKVSGYPIMIIYKAPKTRSRSRMKSKVKSEKSTKL